MIEASTVIPVKILAKSKSRLAGILSDGERAELSFAMFQDMLKILLDVQDATTITIVTDDPSVAQRSLSAGVRVVPECGVGVNAALDHLAGRLTRNGITSLLILSADLPTVTRLDIDTLVRRRVAAVAIVPALADGGTNALLSSPPNAIAFQFGDESAANHLAAARLSRVTAQQMLIPNLQRDIDRLEDLSWLVARDGQGETHSFLARRCIAERLRHASDQPA
jgi:2-phospho-L-lactate/phosphoenolpyruvate guanylyltransferase